LNLQVFRKELRPTKLSIKKTKNERDNKKGIAKAKKTAQELHKEENSSRIA
jgi:hypothetical protein